jgi:hypothetical protein
MHIFTEQVNGEYKVSFGYNDQIFTLDGGGTKEEAVWQADMLRQCFDDYEKYEHPECTMSPSCGCDDCESENVKQD